MPKPRKCIPIAYKVMPKAYGNLPTGFTLTLSHVLPGHEEHEYSVYNNAWDMDFDGLLELFRDISLAAGFHPDTVNKVFGH